MVDFRLAHQADSKARMAVIGERLRGAIAACRCSGTGKCAAHLRLYSGNCFGLAPGAVFLGGEERLV